jgi:hypothetical protein
VFPLGSFVVLKNLRTDREAFLDGHSHEINCIAISKDGTKLASGQKNITGVKVGLYCVFIPLWGLLWCCRLMVFSGTLQRQNVFWKPGR